MQIEEFQKKDWFQVRSVALSSWLFTYKEVFSKEFIHQFIDKNYSKKALEDAFNWSKLNSGWFIVIKDGEKIVGFASFGKDKQIWKLFRIYLLPDYFRKGCGRELVNNGEGFMRSKQVKNYFVLVHKDNAIGMNFYLKMGFNYYPKGDLKEELCMVKNLV